MVQMVETMESGAIFSTYENAKGKKWFPGFP